MIGFWKKVVIGYIFVVSLFDCGELLTQEQIDQQKARNDKQIYERFRKIQTDLLNTATKIEDSGFKGDDKLQCKWRSGLLRVNNTRFFIIDSEFRKDVESNWTVAREFCNSLNEEGLPTGKWRLARIEHLSTFRLITRLLESVSVNLSRTVVDTGYKDSWYWIDAYFNYTSNVYVNSDGEVFKFNNVLLYRNFRPLGLGAHERFDKTFDFAANVKKNYQQCLTLALPWPNNNERAQYSGRFFGGHQASFDARACEASQKFKPICENISPACRWYEDLRNFNFFASEGYAQKSYTDDGVWIFANRRFLVNLKPRNKTESKDFCESLGAQLYTPAKQDECLIAYIKLWNIRLTHLHFWTSIKASYTGKQGEEESWMFYENNTQFNLQNSAKFISADRLRLNIAQRADHSFNWAVDEKQSAAVQKSYPNLCVTAVWLYEYPNETSWTDTLNWNLLTFAYAHCNLYMGTICEPTVLDFEGTHKCNWRKGWTANYELALNATAVIEFGFEKSGIYRSTYKQQFGQHICQTKEIKAERKVDYEISLDTLDYHNVTVKELSTKVKHYYDYLEPYWVVDHTVNEDDWFQNATKDVEACKISQAIRIPGAKGDQIAFRREITTVNCLEWHFYLCGPETYTPWDADDDE